MNSYFSTFLCTGVLYTMMIKKKRITAALLALGLGAVTMFSQFPVSAAEETAQNTDAAAQTADPSVVVTNGIDGWPQASDISSAAAIVMETSTNTVLYSKNADQPLYPASAVKIMTCLVALENSSLDEQVTMTATGVSGVTDGGANISSQLDEVFTMEQCLYAIMVASANDIALQVAEHVGGSVDAFVQIMNTRAQELGCTNTVFTNPTGLPDENQHITAHDMALIMEAAMANDTFRTIAATTSYTLPATNVSGGERVLTNNFTMINSTSDGYYKPCIGGKEGYTEASGSTLVCEASKNNMKLVCIVLNGASGVTDDEAIALLNYGFDNFAPLTIADDDFNRLSGGTVIAPNGATEDNLTTEDTSSDGQITRQYYFGGTPVGTAILEDAEQQTNDAAVTGQKNMEAAQAECVLAKIGNLISWIFTPLGWGDWKMTVAAITGLVAKENVVGTFGQLFGFAEVAEDGQEIWGTLANSMSQIAAYSFLVFNLLCAPCFAAMGAIKREMNNAKWFWFAIGYQCLLAYLVSLCIFQFGTLFTGGGFGIGTVAAIVILIGFLYMLFRPYKESTSLKANTVSSVKAASK